MKYISSRNNPEIKQVAALHSSKERYARGKCIAEGIRTIETMIDGGIKPFAVYCTQAWVSHSVSKFPEPILTEVTDEVMEKISSSTTPSGILAVFPLSKKPIQDLSAGIVLATLADPGNMGTLIRTCAAMGKKTVCCIGGVDPWNPKVIQASAGTIAFVNILQGTWAELIHHLNTLSLYALVIKNGQELKTVEKEDALIVIGNEAHGIPSAWLAECDKHYTLAMPGNIESLNAAVAGSIAMYLMWS